MVERTVVSDAPAPAAPAAPAPTDVRVLTESAPVLGVDREGNQKMQPGLTRFEATPASGAPGGPERPAWLPAKFKSPEDMAQAYGQLEQRLGQIGNMPVPTPAAPVAPAGPANAQTPAAPAKTAGDLQVRLMQEYASTGQVSPALRQEFEQRTGLDPSFIDQQIAYLRHQGASAQQMAEQRLGGKAAVAELTEWAKANVSQPEREAFNRLVYSGDEAAAQLAIDGLAAKYEAAVGRAPKIIAGRRPQNDYGGIVPFQSEQELRMAQRDPRYKEDPAFRDQVQDRLNASMRLGLIR